MSGGRTRDRLGTDRARARAAGIRYGLAHPRPRRRRGRRRAGSIPAGPSDAAHAPGAVLGGVPAPPGRVPGAGPPAAAPGDRPPRRPRPGRRGHRPRGDGHRPRTGRPAPRRGVPAARARGGSILPALLRRPVVRRDRRNAGRSRRRRGRRAAQGPRQARIAVQSGRHRRLTVDDNPNPGVTPLNELSEPLRQAVGQVRAEPVPADALARALERAEKLAALAPVVPPRRRRPWLYGTLAAAAVVLVALGLLNQAGQLALKRAGRDAEVAKAGPERPPEKAEQKIELEAPGPERLFRGNGKAAEGDKDLGPAGVDTNGMNTDRNSDITLRGSPIDRAEMVRKALQ